MRRNRTANLPPELSEDVLNHALCKYGEMTEFELFLLLRYYATERGLKPTFRDYFFLDSLTLEDVTNRQSRNVRFKLFYAP